MKTAMTRREFLGTAAAVSAGLAFPVKLFAKRISGGNAKFHFIVLSDAHMCNKHREFRDFTCDAVLKNKYGPGAFLINNGDMDPFERVEKATRKRLLDPLKAKGVDYHWYPNTGNHDMFNTSNDPEFRTDEPQKTQIAKIIEYNKKNLKNVVNWGPVFNSKLPGYGSDGSKRTTYSFDYGNSHFIVLDLYYPNTKPARGCGNFHKVTEKWLEDDLRRNKKRNVFVFGHQPVIPYETFDGELHAKGMVNFRREQMWTLLKKHRVNAYFCGHTHKYGVVAKDGVTQINTGKCGIEPNCAFTIVFVDGSKITYKTMFHERGKWREFEGKIS